MTMSFGARGRAQRWALLAATMMSGLGASGAYAQAAAPVADAPGTSDASTEIVVTGYRRSLTESTQAKRAALKQFPLARGNAGEIEGKP